MAGRKRAPHEAWNAVKKMIHDDDEMDRILAMSDAEVDAELAAAGFDPAGVRARGEALVRELEAKYDGASWQERTRARLEHVRALATEGTKRREKLPRAELLARIEVARRDPRFASPVAALFRGRGEAESSDEELEAILDEIELLKKLADEE